MAAPTIPDTTPTAESTKPARLYRRGVLSPEETLLDQLDFDVYRALDSIAVLEQELRNVAKHRWGAIITARKGVGKSIGLEEAVAAFEEAEETKAQHEDGYVRRVVELLPPTCAHSRTELVRALYVLVFGSIDPKARSGGDAVMLREIIEAWREEGVVAVAFDEGELLSGTALDVPRDIMAISRSAEGRAMRPRAGRRRGARGIGVLMVGTAVMAERLRRTPEYKERWIKDIEVNPLDGSELPALYGALLACCAREERRVGPEAWGRFFAKHVAGDIGGSLRRVEYHLREYVTLCVDNLEQAPTSIERVPFVEELFLDALKALAGSSEFTTAA